MASLTWVLINAVVAKKRNKGKFENCETLTNWLDLFENYRQLEYAVFFCQIVALSTYLLVCKLLALLKERVATADEIAGLIRTGDPFWNMLLVAGKMDFMQQENLFMQTITLLMLNIAISTLGTFAVYQGGFDA